MGMDIYAYATKKSDYLKRKEIFKKKIEVNARDEAFYRKLDAKYHLDSFYDQKDKEYESGKNKNAYQEYNEYLDKALSDEEFTAERNEIKNSYNQLDHELDTVTMGTEIPHCAANSSWRFITSTFGDPELTDIGDGEYNNVEILIPEDKAKEIINKYFEDNDKELKEYRIATEKLYDKLGKYFGTDDYPIGGGGLFVDNRIEFLQCVVEFYNKENSEIPKDDRAFVVIINY